MNDFSRRKMKQPRDPVSKVHKIGACGNPVHLLCSLPCMPRDFFLAARGSFHGQSDLVGDTREGFETPPATFATLATQGNS